MGMGKTAITLTAAEKLMCDYFSVRKILVIAPLEPAKNTWPEEIKKWDHLKHLTVSSIIGSAAAREEANGRPILIFYMYKHEKHRITERHPEAVEVKADNAVALWNKTEIPILLAHPASAGHGLNLQYGGHIIIRYSLPCSLELYQQANKRLHRMGQKDTVLIHHLIMKNTIDSRILDGVLTAKEQRQEALITALKARIKEVHND